MVQYFILSSFPNLKPTHLRNFQQMSNVNATRRPGILILIAYVGDDVNHTLTRGERWAQYPCNDSTIALICYVLAFVNYQYPQTSASPFLNHKGVAISLLIANTRQFYWPRLVVDLDGYSLSTIQSLDGSTSRLGLYLFQDQKHPIISCRHSFSFSFSFSR